MTKTKKEKEEDKNISNIVGTIILILLIIVFFIIMIKSYKNDDDIENFYYEPTPYYESDGFFSECVKEKIVERIKFSSQPKFKRNCCLNYCDINKEIKEKYWNENTRHTGEEDYFVWYLYCQDTCEAGHNYLTNSNPFFSDKELIELYNLNCIDDDPYIYNETYCVKEMLVKYVEKRLK